MRKLTAYILAMVLMIWSQPLLTTTASQTLHDATTTTSYNYHYQKLLQWQKEREAKRQKEELKEYMEFIASLESNTRYSPYHLISRHKFNALPDSLKQYYCVNSYGMLGKYQFKLNTLRMLGFHVSAREFLNNPKLQDSAMVAYLRFNAKRLSTYIEQYSGKTIHGVKISKAGILAGAHLKGAGGIIEFFVRKGWYDRKDRNYLRDANGTHIASYIVKCQDFELTLI